MNNPVPGALRSALPQEFEPRYRPRFHFAPRRNWMNDPNGLVYYSGEYHLFFQYNPHGDQWGHMSWGHAVSHDLLNWEELPVAIPEQEGEMIFSGCIIVDWANRSELGRRDEPPFLAFYTGYDSATDIQRQCLAYSNDRGRSFQFYHSNPLIDPGLAHFRDPKVFYHDESSAWIMLVSLAREHRILFYRSTDLVDWSVSGSFGPAGATGGQWECPDLMQIPLESDPTQSRWVLKVDVDDHFIGGGSGAQYFIGDFDGTTFTIDSINGSSFGEPVDFGPDFYAAVTWSDLPSEQQGPVWVGWMSNHQTGRFYPTAPWRGAQSLPRALYLFEEQGRLKLGQKPLAGTSSAFSEPRTPRTCFHQTITLEPSGSGGKRLELVSGESSLLSLGYSDAHGLQFNRAPQNGHPDQSFTFENSAPYVAAKQITLDLFYDACLVDIFVDGGRRVFSCCVFPDDPRLVSVRVVS